MARGRRRQAWDHTAGLMALMANLNRDPKRRPQPYQPDDFHPLIAKRKTTGVKLTKASFGQFKKAFVGGGKDDDISQPDQGR